ncbi:MAG: FtsX-like permease family protein [Bacteroidota bacterium]
MNSIILTQSAARALFGDEDPIDQNVSISHQEITQGKKIPMKVTAIIQDLPSNSHVNPKYIVNIYSLKSFRPNLESLLGESMGDGENLGTQSYFVCADENTIPIIQNDLQKHCSDLIAKKGWPVKLKPIIRKITDVHFDSEIDWTINHKKADIKYVYIFSIIAFLILVTASINYINLSTAKSTVRAREIGLRKIFGGIRSQLFIQFMIESSLFVLTSTLISILIVILVMPQFNNLAGKAFTPRNLWDRDTTIILVTFISVIIVLAG